MQRQTTLARVCERIVEGGWLLALVLIPTYFNLLSARHFEPDKATTLRAIVLIIVAARLILGLERMGSRPARREEAAPSQGLLRRAWERLRTTPLAIPVLLYVAVFLFATCISVVPGTSFWGSYQRLQGTYTNLSYIGLAAVIVLTVRRHEQLDRLITVGILTSLIVVGYGLVQHFQVDPLPWKGDVVSRVASTMGNSIFVAAYMILVVPLALYRAIAAMHEARQAPATNNPAADWGWAVSYTLVICGGLALVYGAIKFGAVVRTPDLGYWWIYPGALIVAGGLFLLPTLRLHSAERIQAAVLGPGLVMVLYVVVVGFAFTTGQISGTQVVQNQPGRVGTDWYLWTISGTIMVVVAYILFFLLPRNSGSSSRLLSGLQSAGMLIVAGLLLVSIFFTQSRGPWIGAGVGLFVFVTLLLVQLWTRARSTNGFGASLWRNLLIGEIGLAVILGGGILAFNLSDAPLFGQLRETSYIGRMGRLFETETGTGLVRRLIWFGDDKGSGAIGLITADPLRMIIGWGPESMFVAYNRFYPPSLANIEARGASPDRSHEAFLDELVTKGLLGLISYLFVLLSFFALAWKLIRHTESWRMQVLFIACIAVVVSHNVEGFTGIPIVSTLMMLWVTMAILVVGGALAGLYTLDGQSAIVAEMPDTSARNDLEQSGRTRKVQRQQRTTMRGTGKGRPTSYASNGRDPAMWIVYALISLLSLGGAWAFNIDNVYADMLFQQGQGYANNMDTSLEQQILGMNYYIEAIRMEPSQDFYYLNLGRSLMSITDIFRQQGNRSLGQPKPDARIDDLFRLSDAGAIQTFVVKQSLQSMASYAEVVLKRAYELNPLNKDHYANLARLYNFWYSRISFDPERMRLALEWYKRGHEVAPQDVVILNEYAGAVTLMGNYSRGQKDEQAAQTYFDQAQALLAESKRIDPRYSDTDVRGAELLRARGKLPEAVDQYLALLETNPHALDNQLSAILNDLQSHPDLLQRLRERYASIAAKKGNDANLYSVLGLLSMRMSDLPGAVDAYAKVIQLQPQNLEARRNYTLILSNTQHYQQAAAEAQQLLTLAQQQQVAEQDQKAIEGLLNFLKARASGS